MTQGFRRYWLQDAARGPRYVPVLASSASEAQDFVSLTSPTRARVIDENATKTFAGRPRPVIDIRAGWAHLASALRDAVKDPELSDPMIGIDVGHRSVASISLGSPQRAVWLARSDADFDGTVVRHTMETLGWAAVNEHIPANEAVYGQLDVRGGRSPWSDPVDAAIELAVLLVPAADGVVRLFTQYEENSIRQVGPDHRLAATIGEGEKGVDSSQR